MEPLSIVQMNTIGLKALEHTYPDKDIKRFMCAGMASMGY